MFVSLLTGYMRPWFQERPDLSSSPPTLPTEYERKEGEAEKKRNESKFKTGSAIMMWDPSPWRFPYSVYLMNITR
jgi:hypothetical protein